MPLTLTKHNLRACYDFLASTEPFYRWNLPDGEDVLFRVIQDKRFYGLYDEYRGKHRISISAPNNGWTHSVIETMAHEMIHLHERETRMDHPHTQHTAAFRKLAQQVCKTHGFDPHRF